MNASLVHPNSERRLDEAQFERIARIAHQDAGLAIAPAKMAMVQTRLARRLRLLRMNSYPDYCDLVESAEGAAERRELISALTTNVSHFFRESHHFDTLATRALPEIMRNQRIRMWSAGCSNGQEPYSLAVTVLGVLQSGPEIQKPSDIKILATDIDPKVVAFARGARYPSSMIQGIDPDRHKSLFEPGDLSDSMHVISHEARKLVFFKELNLLSAWPMRGSFDVIFCRNTVIYFDEETQEALWRRFAKILKPGGWLFVGHSERVSGPAEALFENLGQTTYQRREANSVQ